MGLLTVAAMLPQDWDLKLIDMNVAHLNDEDLLWADYVFIGAMAIQKPSAEKVVARCTQLGLSIVCRMAFRRLCIFIARRMRSSTSSRGSFA